MILADSRQQRRVSNGHDLVVAVQDKVLLAMVPVLRAEILEVIALSVVTLLSVAGGHLPAGIATEEDYPLAVISHDRREHHCHRATVPGCSRRRDAGRANHPGTAGPSGQAPAHAWQKPPSPELSAA